MKTRRLTKEQHAARVSNGVCPRCGDFRLVHVVRTTDDGRGGTRFGGAFYTCGSESSHRCYWLSNGGSADLRESAEDVEELVIRKVVEPLKAGVVRRRRA